MGKRTRQGGSKGSKRQRSSSVVEPGQYGVFASCNRGREMKAAKELRMILNDKYDELYPEEEEPQEDEEEGSVEDEIAKELAQLKEKGKKKNSRQHISEIQINAESLLFFHMKQPIIPTEFITKLCQGLYESKTKNTRFVQRLTPIDKSCNGTMEEFVKMATPILEANFKSGTTYMVNLTRRNFTAIERDDFMDKIAELLPDCGMRYKDADKIIHIYCFKNSVGMSVTDYKLYEDLAKFNLQQIFDKSNGLVEKVKKVDEKKTEEPKRKPQKQNQTTLEILVVCEQNRTLTNLR